MGFFYKDNYSRDFFIFSYFYSFIDRAGKEWAAVTRPYTKVTFPGLPLYELRSAYRVDCAPFECIIDNVLKQFYRVYEKWEYCERFKLISLQ